jgi:phage terminase Nu1 subunit (DNA packaging protein)
MADESRDTGATRTLVDVNTIAREFGCSERQVQMLVRDGMPKSGRGEYDLVECLRWRIGQHKAEIERAKCSTVEAKSLNEEQARLAKASADLKELKVSQMRGELVPIGIYKRIVGEKFSTVRVGVLSLPDRISARLEGLDRAEIKKRLKEAVREILAELSGGDGGTRAGDSAGEGRCGAVRDNGSAAGGKRKPVGGKKPRAAKGHKQPPRPVAH